MRLCQIEIENFKGISKRQVIPLKPITLLFGPNSAGKSTVLQALQYMREMIERGNFDPDKTISGATDLGGFSTLVHKQNLELPIQIRLEFEQDAMAFDGILNRLQYGPESAFPEPESWDREIADLEEALPMWGVLSEFQIDKIGLEIEVRWSWSRMTAFLSRYSVFYNGERFASVSTDANDDAAWLSDFNFAHPLLQAAEFNDDRTFVTPMPDCESPLSALMGELGIDRISSGGDTPQINYVLPVDLYFPFAICAKRELRYHWANDEGADFGKSRLLARLLDELVLDPALLAKEYLAGVCHIGALRDVPSRRYRSERSPEEASWARGQAAWDLLIADRNGKLTSEVNRWLSIRLGMPYRVDVLTEKRVPVPGLLDRFIQLGLSDADLDELQREYKQYPEQRTLLLSDIQNQVRVALDEVGIGLSQVLPILVAANHQAAELIVVEQPELHLHPAVQVALGDLFIETALGKQKKWQTTRPDRLNLNGSGRSSTTSALIETHSEHLILRLLRRIRETTAQELPPGVKGLKTDQIAVLYVAATDEGVRYSELRVDDEGEFIDRWPNGFFEERTEELF